MIPENFPINQSYLSYFPTIFSTELLDWANQFQRLCKQPIKGVFPYPMDIIKICNKNKKIESLIFDIALAGLTKDDIKVQLKNKKFLTITVQQKNQKVSGQELIEYVNKGISYRDSSITFRIIPEIDLSQFKPTFINGLLHIQLKIKQQSKDSDDVIIAEL